MLYTDGLIEGWADGEGGERWGVDGLCALLAGRDRASVPPADLPAWLVGQVERRNGGPLADDVAVLLLTPSGDVS